MGTVLADGVFRVDLGFVNACPLDDVELTLVDADTAGKAEDVAAALAAAGYAVAGVRRRTGRPLPDRRAGAAADRPQGLLQRVTRRWVDRPAGVERVADGGTVGAFEV